MGRDYPKLNIEDFGAHLLRSGDLDPVYNALWELRKREQWGAPQVYRWLVAYWCLYHCGAACYLSQFQDNEFWDLLLVTARNEERPPVGERWPRGHERRHWRGSNALRSAEGLKSWYEKPEYMVLYCATGYRPEGEGPTMEEALRWEPSMPQAFSDVAARVRNHVGFGPWMAFKVADMLDRLGIMPVNFDRAAVFMFDDPRQAALLLFRNTHKLIDSARIKDEDGVVEQVVEYLTKRFATFDAPPRGERAVGLQEVETILCKWKSHINGHYPLMNDITEIRAGLREWEPHSWAAKDFLGAMPGGGE